MKMEKTSEFLMRSILIDNGFKEECMYDTPNQHIVLKDIFKNSSKTGYKYGIPDCIYFDENTLIIVECKATNLSAAKTDYLTYYNSISKDLALNIYGLAFVSSTKFSIFDKDKEIDALILPTTFGFKQNCYNTITTTMLSRKIHEIHNYIRNFTKISNEDKPFFIACCMIYLKNKNNWILFKNFETKQFLYNTLKETLKNYDIDTTIFDFMKNDNNNKHLWNIIKMILDIIKHDITHDLLNVFYHEFVKYSNTDGKSLGIVLTPEHIVELMVKLLDINKNDIVLDLCSGTGSFLLEAGKYTKNIIGIEYQNKLYQLLYANFILRDMNTDFIYNSNCFSRCYKATKSIINPPYGMKGNEKEIDFIMKQIESIDDMGLAICILPNGCLNKKARKQILESCKVLRIINCRKTLFYPTAVIPTCIILLQKGSGKCKTLIQDYTDDGIECVINSGLVKTDTFTKKFNDCLNGTNGIIRELTVENNWSYYPVNTREDVYKRFYIEEYKRKKQHEMLQEIEHIQQTLIEPDFISMKISDIFKLNTSPNKCVILNKCNICPDYDKNKVVVISASKLNNGVVGYMCPDKKFTLNSGNCLVFSTVGTCFYQKTPFYSTSSIKILRPIKNLSDEIFRFIAWIIMDKYIVRYNKERGFSFEIFKDDILEIPSNFF